MNVRVVSRLVDFATHCTKLIIFLHVSTAFAVQNIQGLAYEKCLDLGHFIRENGQGLGLPIDLLIEIETRAISEVALRINENEQAVEMIKLGMRRAKSYKMGNNYMLTKAMGEMVATGLREKLPIIIIRPSLVESTFKEPFPGWSEGYKALGPIILSYGSGQLEGFHANPDAMIDVVPVDMVVNAMIAAIAKHGNEGKHGVNIYNVTSSLTNPISCQDIFKFSTNYFKSHPLKDSNGNAIIIKDMKFFETLTEFILAGGLSEEATSSSNAKLQNKLLRMAAIYEPLMCLKTWYDDKNTRKLLGNMSLEELNRFNFNLKCINWKHYFININIPGFIQHVFKNKTLFAKL